METYDKLKEWRLFSEQVSAHIVEYTKPQYGNDNGGEELIDTLSAEDCFVNMLRYVNRRKAAVRGNREKLRDVIKIAHYASFIYSKLKKDLGENDIYEVT